MATKTFKLGEVCKGGVLTVKTTESKVTIIAKEWDFSVSGKKGNSQANAKEWNRIEVKNSDVDGYRKLSDFLHDLTTSYHSEKILEWCLENSLLKRKNLW